MMRKYDEEIREVEARLQREREALLLQAEDLGHTARDAAISPKGLLAAAVVGFMLGELTTRPRRHVDWSSTPRKLGLGGLLGGAALAFIRTQYGSPAALGRAAWEYAAELRARRAAAANAATAAGGWARP